MCGISYCTDFARRFFILLYYFSVNTSIGLAIKMRTCCDYPVFWHYMQSEYMFLMQYDHFQSQPILRLLIQVSEVCPQLAGQEQAVVLNGLRVLKAVLQGIALITGCKHTNLHSHLNLLLIMR